MFRFFKLSSITNLHCIIDYFLLKIFENTGEKAKKQTLMILPLKIDILTFMSLKKSRESTLKFIDFLKKCVCRSGIIKVGSSHDVNLFF